MKVRFFIVLTSITLACSHHKQMEKADLVQFVSNEDSGLTVKAESGEYMIEATYRPTDLIVTQQMNDLSEVDSLRKALGKYAYFILSISREGHDLETVMAANRVDFAEGISYLSSGFVQEIKILTDESVLDLTDFLYTRTYGQGGSKFLLVFERPDEDFKLTINGSHLGFGRVKLPFDIDDINNAPELLFDNL